MDAEAVCRRDETGVADRLHDALGPDGERPGLGDVGHRDAHGSVQSVGDRHAAGNHAGAQLVDAGGGAGPPGAVDGDGAGAVGSHRGADPRPVRDALGASVLNPKRLGNAAEYANLALCMIENGYFNGEDVRLDGGIRMAPR